MSLFTPDERVVVQEYLRRKKEQKKGSRFLDYVAQVCPFFIFEEIHVLIARRFEQLKAGKIDRLMISMPPRAGKSLLASELLPAWWMGHYPTDKILHTSYASTLVEKFGRKIRNQIMDAAYQEMFPGTQIARDSRSAGQWSTSLGGEYNAIGVGGGAAGKGGNLICVDDIVSEQDMFSKTTHDNVYEWYQSGLYSRRQPERNAFIIMMTRWRTDDLIGRLLADSIVKSEADQWENLSVPAILDQESADLLNECSNDPHIKDPYHYTAGDSFSPRRWPLKELLRTKHTLGRKAFSSLYQQSPVIDGGNIIQTEWWKPWKEGTALPKIEYILQSYDTAYEEGQSNDFSARVTLGVFKRQSDNRMCAILLERLKERLTFPNLLEEALTSYKEYKPDRVIIEKAASGAPLLQELRKRGIPVTPIPPKGSKIARANAAAIMLEQGSVYYPDGKKWAQEVIDDCAAFPNGAHDDIPDALFHALNFIRRTFLLETPDDEEVDEDETTEKPPTRSYARRQSRLRVAA